MRNGFMTLLIGLAGVPDAQELMPFLLDAYRMWGGKGYYVSNPPQHSLKRWIARGALKVGGLTLLHWLLKQAFAPAPPYNSPTWRTTACPPTMPTSRTWR